MQVILLERIGRLGQMGDVVNVKDGYARNFLLPQRKALRATEDNRKRFERERAQLEARNLELQARRPRPSPSKLDGKSFVVIRQAGETGQLYGSVSTRDIAEVVTAGGFSVERRQVVLDRPIKTIGLHEVRIALHPEVEVHDHDQRRPLRGRGRAAGARRGSDRHQGGGGRDRDVHAEALFEEEDAAAASEDREEPERLTAPEPPVCTGRGSDGPYAFCCEPRQG